MAVRNHAEPLLQLAYGVAQIEIEMAVEIRNLVAEISEPVLQRDALVARRLEIVGGPGAAEWQAPRSRSANAATASA